MSEWISINDGLPKDGKYVLVFDVAAPGLSIETAYSTASYKDGVWSDYLGDDHLYAADITHWMVLPPPPKE